jgi:hypothetical protein
VKVKVSGGRAALVESQGTRYVPPWEAGGLELGTWEKYSVTASWGNKTFVVPVSISHQISPNLSQAGVNEPTRAFHVFVFAALEPTE